MRIWFPIFIKKRKAYNIFVDTITDEFYNYVISLSINKDIFGISTNLRSGWTPTHRPGTDMDKFHNSKTCGIEFTHTPKVVTEHSKVVKKLAQYRTPVSVFST